MNDPTHTPCVVVADDDSGLRSLLAKVLKRRGFEVLEASDGEEALGLAMSRPVDAMVCDLQMPRMRGEDLGRWMQQLEPDLPVVFITAYPAYESALAAVRCRAADYLEKPFRRIDDVADALERALRRRAEAQGRGGLAKVDAQKQAREEMRNRYVAAVTSDMRVPIEAVRSLVALLGRGVHGPLTTEQREILEHLASEGDALAHDADRLLGLARIESPDVAPAVETVAVAEILRPVERAFAARAAERRIHLIVECPDGGVPVRADAADVTRVLRALVDNALKFTGEDGEVTVGAIPHRDGVLFFVDDTGIGIDAEDHARIFEPWVQLANPITRRAGGCGLGLALAARIVGAHGSQIHLRSQVGEGATFSFLLPQGSRSTTESCTSEVRAAPVTRG